MQRCWCYQCNAPCELTEDLKCTTCNEDFVEYESSIAPSERVARTQVGLSMTINMPGQPGPITLNIPINPMNIANQIFGTGGEANQGVGNWFQRVLGRLPNLLGLQPRNGDGQQMGDFFLGSEEQLHMLADRLMQMDRQSLGSPPTDEAFVDELKPVTYKRGDCVEETCSICLDDLEDGQDVMILPCRHGFHPDCISPWLKMHSECPICRHKLPSK